jgi:hypothetical protein
MGKMQRCDDGNKTMNPVSEIYDPAREMFEHGQELLKQAAETGDPILGMQGGALCHQAIELRWYTHTEGNILDPPWVKRSIVTVGSIQYQAPGPNLGVGDQEFYDWLNDGKTPLEPVAMEDDEEPPEGQLALW